MLKFEILAYAHISEANSAHIWTRFFFIDLLLTLVRLNREWAINKHIVLWTNGRHFAGDIFKSIFLKEPKNLCHHDYNFA